MRLFVAIELPEDIREELVVVEEKLENFFKARWVAKDNIHLTLKFLGDVEEKMLEDIKKTVSEISQKNHRFDLTLEDIGGFPNLKRPRVLWIGVEQGKKNTMCLMEQLEKELTNFGIKPEKREKSPHITIGRVKGLAQRDTEKRQEDIHKLTYKSRVFRADAVSLIQSVLTPSGAVYTVLERYMLCSKDNIFKK
ncbi:MAG: RNA 2',3'-cyclic phosphodiesterase [bacterium]|nr:RNA 2',3'-cyclic phosphodiesterase [bacterium]